MEERDYRQSDGVGLAELVAKGDAGAEEILDAAIARAETVNPTINTLARVRYHGIRCIMAPPP